MAETDSARQKTIRNDLRNASPVVHPWWNSFSRAGPAKRRRSDRWSRRKIPPSRMMDQTGGEIFSVQVETHLGAMFAAQRLCFFRSSPRLWDTVTLKSADCP